jgi:amino acid adenylation domain-containing protein
LGFRPVTQLPSFFRADDALTPFLGAIMEAQHITESFVLSPMQQGMLFEEFNTPGSGINVVRVVINWKHEVQTASFEQTWNALIARHTILRTGFRMSGEERGMKDEERTLARCEPVQDIHHHCCFRPRLEDWQHCCPQERESRLQNYLNEDRRRGFRLEEPPLMRVALFKFAEADYRCVWTFHHLLLDGRSMPLILGEVFDFYQALVRGEDLQLPARRPYRDYVELLTGQDLSQAKAFWRTCLQGFEAPNEFRIRPPEKLSCGEDVFGECRQSIALTTAEALRAAARKHQVTVNSFAQAAWAILVSRYSGQQDVVFGIIRACRHSPLDGSDSMLGSLINTLPLRVAISTGLSVRALVRDLRSKQLALRPYEQTPLVEIQRLSDVPAGMRLFQSILAFENRSLDLVLRAEGKMPAHCRLQLLECPTNYPLALHCFIEPEMTVKMIFDRRRFEAATITRMLSHYQTLLEGIVADPERPVSALPLLTEQERRQLIVEWNQSKGTYPPDRCIHEWFEVRVEQAPDAVAVVFEEQRLTYGELNAQANELAHYLRRFGVGPDVLVGICVERSLEMVVGILGILKAGGAYVPLDPTYPKERLAFMLEDARPLVLLTQAHLVGALPESQPPLVLLDKERELIAQESQANPLVPVSADNLAYVIYTSGSTGTPKGVAIPHGNVGRLFTATEPWYHFDANDVWSLFHSYAFDFSVWELWGALLYGGRLVVVPHSVSRSPEAFYASLSRHEVTVLNQTPSAFRHLIRAEESFAAAPPLRLRLIILGGEKLEPASLKPWFERHGERCPQLVNMYGITETTVHVTYYPLEAADAYGAARSPIGRPIPDLEVYLLDPNGQPVPTGVPGEIHVGGAGLARGYLNHPELTAEKFITSDIPGMRGRRLYKSGDVGRWLPNGTLEYLCRLDHQVKIRGFRVELGEIETVLGQHPEIKEGVVIGRGDAGGNIRLVAYVVPRRHSLTVGKLNSYLREKLPRHMVPAAFVMLTALPLTPNGKVDREALPAPASDRPDLGHAYAAPRTPVEEALCAIWGEVLQLERVGIHDDFFELGGHSLLAMQVVARARTAFSLELSLSSLFSKPTIASLAEEIVAILAAGADEEVIARALYELEDAS